MKTTKIILIAMCCLLLSVGSLLADKAITASALPAGGELVSGQTIDIPVTIDLSNYSKETALGSFTASLQWNPQVLEFLSWSGGSSKGFQNPVVNDQDASGGLLRFAHANPYGATGVVNVLNLKFKVIGKAGSSASLSLNFTAMAAAGSFENLIPALDPNAEAEKTLIIKGAPQEYGVKHYPNPFNPSTVVEYSLPEANKVSIRIFNVLGQKVRVLVDRFQQPGSYKVVWDGKDEFGNPLPSGMYFLHMKAGKFTAERKLLFMK